MKKTLQQTFFSYRTKKTEWKCLFVAFCRWPILQYRFFFDQKRKFHIDFIFFYFSNIYLWKLDSNSDFKLILWMIERNVEFILKEKSFAWVSFLLCECIRLRQPTFNVKVVQRRHLRGSSPATNVSVSLVNYGQLWLFYMYENNEDFSELIWIFHIWFTN